MAKLLNLDTLVPAVKQVQIGGKQYPIVEMSVGLFAEIKRFEGSEIESMSIADQVAAYAVLVQADSLSAAECVGRSLRYQPSANFHLRTERCG
jgi:hypothetical protein